MTEKMQHKDLGPISLISQLSEEKLKFYLSCLARNVLKLKKLEELAIFKSLSQQLGTMYVSET